MSSGLILTWIQEEHDIQCMPCSSRIISEMLPEMHITEKCDFPKPIVHSPIIYFSVTSVCREDDVY